MKSTKCGACNKDAKVSHEHRVYCESCYLNLIERRVRKFARQSDLFHKHDTIYVPDVLSEYLVQKIVQGMPVKIVHNKTKSSKNIILWTLDDESAKFMDALFSNSLIKNFKQSSEIKLFRNVTDEELHKYSKIVQIKFKPNKKPKSYLFIDKIIHRYPLTNYGISSTIHQLDKVLK